MEGQQEIDETIREERSARGAGHEMRDGLASCDMQGRVVQHFDTDRICLVESVQDGLIRDACVCPEAAAKDLVGHVFGSEVGQGLPLHETKSWM